MRQPIYDEANPQVRIISAPNGLWQVQLRTAEKGTRERSNWDDQHAPMPLEAAKAVMGYFA